MDLAPIVLFVYNRSLHTRLTLEALMANGLADQSLLYIYADGPKAGATADELRSIEEVRKVIRERKWCKEVKIVESEHNKGLADSIVKGVTEVITRHKKVIVLEDDILTSLGFLKYMNDALVLYEQEEVMHVSGYFLPVKNNQELPETFFYNETSCWGWGTWDHAWSNLILDPQYLLSTIEATKQVDKFNLDNAYAFTDQLKDNIQGKMHTWAIKWNASVFLKNGLCLHPRMSLVKNIGFDGTGEHCMNTDRKYENQTLATEIIVKKIPLKELALARDKVKSYHRARKRKTMKKAFRKLKHTFYKFFDNY